MPLFIKNGWHGWRASCIWKVNFKRIQEVEFHSIEGALSSLRQFLATESPLNMTKNDFYFILKPLLVLRMFKFFFLEFSVMSKDEVNFKIYDVTVWLTNSYTLRNISRRKGNHALKFGQFIEQASETFFKKNHTQNAMENSQNLF